MPPSNREESFRAYAQLAARDSLALATPEDEAVDPPSSPPNLVDSQDSGPELSFLFPPGVEHCFAITIDAQEEGPVCQVGEGEVGIEGPIAVPAEGNLEQEGDASQLTESPLLIHMSPGTPNQIFRAWAQ